LQNLKAPDRRVLPISDKDAVAMTAQAALVPAPVVASVPVVRPYVNPLAVDPVTGVFLTDE
jgi:hypothetical protein